MQSPSAASSAGKPPVPTFTSSRRGCRKSKVRSIFAATRGATNPGRTATSIFSVSGRASHLHEVVHGRRALRFGPPERFKIARSGQEPGEFGLVLHERYLDVRLMIRRSRAVSLRCACKYVNFQLTSHFRTYRSEEKP